MKHVHHDMIVAWAADPSRVVESETDNGHWVTVSNPVWWPHVKYRFKPDEPKYIVVNGVNVPEPVREPLKEGQLFWIASTSFGSPCSYHWNGAFSEKRWLSYGLIHLTEEAAQAHIDAMLLPSRTDK